MLKYCLAIIVMVESLTSEMFIQEVGSQIHPIFQKASINCLHTQKSHNDSLINLLICNRCDIYHVVVEAHSNSTWERTLTLNITHQTSCYSDYEYTTDAVFISTSDTNVFNVIYVASGGSSRMFNQRYEILETGSIHVKYSSNLDNRGIGHCNGLFYSSKFHAIFIADSFRADHVVNSGQSIKELELGYNTTTRIADLPLCYPHDLTQDPENYRTIFVVTSVDLKKIEFIGRRVEKPTVIYFGEGMDTSGRKVLALKSDKIFVVPHFCGLKLINLRTHTITEYFSSYEFTGISFHPKSDTLFLSTMAKLYFISNITMIVQQLTETTTMEPTTATDIPTTQSKVARSTVQSLPDNNRSTKQTQTKPIVPGSALKSEQSPPVILSNNELIIMNLSLLATIFLIGVIVAIYCRKQLKCRKICDGNMYDEAGMPPPESGVQLEDRDLTNGLDERCSEVSTHAYSSIRGGGSPPVSIKFNHRLCPGTLRVSMNSENTTIYEGPDPPNMDDFQNMPSTSRFNPISNHLLQQTASPASSSRRGTNVNEGNSEPITRGTYNSSYQQGDEYESEFSSLIE